MEKSTRFFEGIVLVMLITAFSYLLYVANSTEADYAASGISSMGFPKVIFSLIIGLCAFKLAGNIRWQLKNRQAQDSLLKLDKRIYLTLGLIVAYTMLWNIIGFCLSTFIFFTVQSQVLETNSSWRMSGVLGLSATVIMYFIFGVLFKVYFPEPLWDMLFY